MSYTNGLDKPSDYFNTVLWTGNGTGQSITGVGFSPEFLWLKERTSTSNHRLSDIIRGTNKQLSSNVTDAEETISTVVSSYDSDGFTVGADNGSNESGQTYVGWNWLAGGTGVSNTNGDITSTVSANTTSGFSIVKFTKTNGEVTVGHGLNAKPSLIIFKPLATANWIVTPEINGSMANNYLLLHSTDALGTGGAFSNPTNSVFSISNNIAPNSEHIAYCFANKKGFSKIGTYTGNGNVDGTFVYTGFKPAMIIIKKNGAGDNWHIYDNKVNPTNVMDTNLRPNLSDAEITNANHNLDFVSNGFKWRTTSNTRQGNGSEVIYMAFAESPLVTSTGIPTTAR